MFDEGQRLPSPYHRTKFESEKIVREECSVPWRVYRPAIVVGDCQTGAMDKIDGPYYFFPLLKRMRDTIPRLGAARRRRPRRHQRGAGRLRREGDGPHRPRTRPRRPGLPPGQPRAAEHGRRAGQHLRGSGQGPAVRDPGRPQRHRPACRPACYPGARGPRRCSVPHCGSRPSTSPSTRPSGGSASRPRCSATSPSPRSTPRAPPRRPCPGRASRCPTSSPTRPSCGPTGRKMLDDSIKNDSAVVEGAHQTRRS